MDAQSFLGARQYSRVSFEGSEHFFKCALYIYGANHGQFNSVWGRLDNRPPIINMMNLKPIMPFEDQQKIAKVYISAFLEATLRDEREYEKIFRDYRSAGAWLPPTIYLSHYLNCPFSNCSSARAVVPPGEVTFLLSWAGSWPDC